MTECIPTTPGFIFSQTNFFFFRTESKRLSCGKQGSSEKLENNSLGLLSFDAPWASFRVGPMYWSCSCRDEFKILIKESVAGMWVGWSCIPRMRSCLKEIIWVHQEMTYHVRGCLWDKFASLDHNREMFHSDKVSPRFLILHNSKYFLPRFYFLFIFNFVTRRLLCCKYSVNLNMMPINPISYFA